MEDEYANGFWRDRHIRPEDRRPARGARVPDIDQGVALLHNFQWSEASRAFERASRRDSRCAICHWGQAMALTLTLMGGPNEADMAQARVELQAARAGTGTPRERGYIRAAEAFFREAADMTPRQRLREYSDNLGQLRRHYPSDVDAAAFYGLSLIALANEEENPIPLLRQALDVLEPEFRTHPNHPGIVHYLIHAADVPELASRGLDAARVYARLAPDSSHALHMPSHIFVRLGLWSEVIASNRRAATVGATAAAHHHGEATYQLHALDYLIYASLQRGDEATVRAILPLRDVPGADAGLLTYQRTFFAAQVEVELHRWKEAALLPAPTLPANFLVTTYWARTIGAARSGDLPKARESMSRLREAAEARQVRRSHGGPLPSEETLEVVEAQAWLVYAEGRINEAADALRMASDREAADGGESTTVPASEMLADLLLDANRPGEALAWYERTLGHAPNRFNSLIGTGRAAEALGDVSRARSSYARLLSIVAPTANRPELAQVRSIMRAR